MSTEWRIMELERRSVAHGRLIEQLLARLAAAEQTANLMAGGIAVPTAPSNDGSVTLAVASGAITASSATAPGYGYATPIAYDVGMAAYVSTGSAVAVLNAGAEIASSKRCFLVVDPTGDVYATPEEC